MATKKTMKAARTAMQERRMQKAMKAQKAMNAALQAMKSKESSLHSKWPWVGLREWRGLSLSLRDLWCVPQVFVLQD